MTPDRLQQLQDLFTAARALASEAERERLLQQQAGNDPELADHARALLLADAQPGIIDALASHFVPLGESLKEQTPDRIGAYRVLKELGRGGAGVVYLADRADGEFRHRVAIKLIGTSDTGDPLHQRFLAERQILAALIHPHIARLLDGGVTDDGRPYLVMEYVDGLPITTYCDDRRLNVRARLRLFADVCAAVQHAHNNLIIHRDLKPSNILVSTDGRVHLLDFGIAKLINPTLAAPQAPLTRADTRMMTPEYASPEQVRGESMTTASDVYSLGVLLYELLCGSRPYQLTTGSPVEIVTAVCYQDPEPPSVRARDGERDSAPEAVARLRGASADKLAGLLSGDLDGIVLMAMRKEPDRRYPSADMLRQDIDRYLSGLPVLAHRGGRRYRLGKFLRRNRIEATAAALVLVALVAGLSIALVQGGRASRERDRAAQALAESTGVTNFLVGLFQAGEAGASPPAQLSALDLLQRGANRASELSNQPLVYARLLDVIGQMSLHLARLDEAQHHLEQAVTIRRSARAAAVDVASSLIHLSWVYRNRNEYDHARKLVTEALDLRRAALPPGHVEIADALYELGWLATGSEQERLYREALVILSETAPANEQRVAILQALSTNLRRQGRLPDAVATDREAVALAERFFGADHHVTGYAMVHLADHIGEIEGDVVTAERLYRRGLELLASHFGENSVRLIHGLNSLAGLLASRGDNEAERHYRRALAIRQAITGPEHPRVADQLHELAGELARQGRLAEAETLARQALDLSIRTNGPRHQVIATARLPLLANVLDRARRYREADETYRAAFDQAPASPINVGQMHRAYGLMLLRRGEHARAETHLLQSLALLAQAYRGADHPNVQETKRGLMDLYGRLGDRAAVERHRVPPGRFIPY